MADLLGLSNLKDIDAKVTVDVDNNFWLKFIGSLVLVFTVCVIGYFAIKGLLGKSG